jgi:hypothetical protein
VTITFHSTDGCPDGNAHRWVTVPDGDTLRQTCRRCQAERVVPRTPAGVDERTLLDARCNVQERALRNVRNASTLADANAAAKIGLQVGGGWAKP